MNIVPAFIRRRIAHRPNLVKIVDNIGWLFFDKVLRMGVGLLVGVWVARYLGPEQFGLLNFALAFTGLFGAIATLGLQGIVVRDIVRDPAGARLTLGTAAMLQLVGGLVSFLLILAAIAYLRPDDALSRTIVAILGAMMLLKASEIAVYWFESKVQSKYTVWVQNSVFLVFAAVKVGMILLEAELIAFVWAMLIEAVAVAAILLLVFNIRGQAITNLQASLRHAKKLLKDSWPLFLSVASITVYTKIDQIMIGSMIGDQAVGIYSAALRLSEIWYFIPTVIVASVFPSIVESKKKCEVQYHARLQKLYTTMVIMSVSVAIPVMLLSKHIVALIFGPEFSGAGFVLSIQIWSSVFVFLSLVNHAWYLAENLQKLSLQRTAFCASANIILNLLLIPEFGINGAAVALLISVAIAYGFFDGIQKTSRIIFFMKMKSINPVNWRGAIILQNK